MSVSDQQHELDWLAFQYVAGELDASAAEAFELRLADDQPAREAVARAVRLTQVIVAAERQVAELPQRELVLAGSASPVEKRAIAWGKRLSWMAIGGLLSFLAAVWLGGTFRAHPGGAGSGDSLAGGQLAEAWYETRQQLRAAADVGPLHPLFAALDDEEDVVGNAASSGAILSDDELLRIDTPTWMTAAVAGVEQQGSDNAPEDEESGVN